MEKLNFVAIDVETADSSRPESICQIGLAVVRDGLVVDTFASAVRTPHPFGWWQRSNLSLTEDEVASARPFDEIIRSISHLMAGPVFSHTSYDRFAIGLACNLCNFKLSDTIWLDSAQVV